MTTTLPDPVFIESDPSTIEAELVARFEELTGRTLYPAQVERLLLDFIAWRESLVRIGIQDAAKLNLVRYSRAPILDFIGELLNCPRLPSQSAHTTLRGVIASPFATNLLIPAGTRVQSADASVVFATDEDELLIAGATQIDIAGTCTVAGVIGNGWQSGQVGTLLDTLALPGVTFSNVAVPSGGAEQEEDEPYKVRIMLAPEAFSTAGSIAAYRFFALSAHQSIIDVTVTSPIGGTVNLYILTKTGLPSSDILTLVSASCSAEKVRPLCDTVVPLAPTQYDYSIVASLIFYDDDDDGTTLVAAQAAANKYIADRSAGLGRDIVVEQITAVLQVPGVYRAIVTTPSALHVLANSEWANCTGVTVTPGGTADG